MEYFSFPSNPNWAVVVKDISDWTAYEKDNEGKIIDTIIPQPADIAIVLDLVKRAFEKYYPSERINNLHIPVLHDEPVPSSYKLPEIVFLSSKGRYWSMYIYQFAHELCHIMIGAKIPDRFRWFEEAICEVSSQFFLMRLSELWFKNPPYPNWISYAPYIAEYRNIQALTAYDLAGQSLTDFTRANIARLTADPYWREANTLFANNLLPIFEKEPGLWCEIQRLVEFCKGNSLSDLLSNWNNSTNYSESVREMAILF
ncbi:MAG: hypothetical protein FWF44_00055 [Defluviitaleaceae bacterium]|nr:hypothetical protein [Defluviitaleaceae bacterium]